MIKKINLFKENCAELLATFLYVGYAPVMPGTIASLVTMALWFIMPPVSAEFFLLFCVVIGFLGVWASFVIEQKKRLKDPSYIVIDEVFGMSIALCMLPKILLVYLGALVLFRFFDITKIFPVYLAEKYLQGGWGVMCDDLVAGLMARVCLALLMMLVA